MLADAVECQVLDSKHMWEGIVSRRKPFYLPFLTLIIVPRTFLDTPFKASMGVHPGQYELSTLLEHFHAECHSLDIHTSCHQDNLEQRPCEELGQAVPFYAWDRLANTFMLPKRAVLASLTRLLSEISSQNSLLLPARASEQDNWTCCPVSAADFKSNSV